MTDRPILFSAPMVQAILAGRKTVTRRILKPQPRIRPEIEDRWWVVYDGDQVAGRQRARFVEGDRLWVREAGNWSVGKSTLTGGNFGFTFYAADSKRGRSEFFDDKNRPGIHMPRWASRITLSVNEVRIERLQDISEEDAIAEGIDQSEAIPGQDFDINGDWWPGGPKRLFKCLWESLHGAGSWADNPWVVAISFRPVLANIDSAKARAA